MIYKGQRIGSVKKKVLLLLFSGIALGLTKSPRKQWWILRQIPKEWQKEDQQALMRAIRSLYISHLVMEKHNQDGTTTLILSEKGRQKALTFNIDELEIKVPKVWDKKWRIIMFDIPERLRKLRDSLRIHFNEIGFVELQKSVFVFPYPCEKELEFIVEFYNARKYIRFIVAEKIDNELHLAKKFNLC